MNRFLATFAAMASLAAPVSIATTSLVLAEALAFAGFDSYALRADLADRDIWYRVRIGRYASYSEARSAGRRLMGSGHVREYVVTGSESER